MILRFKILIVILIRCSVHLSAQSLPCGAHMGTLLGDYKTHTYKLTTNIKPVAIQWQYQNARYYQKNRYAQSYEFYLKNQEDYKEYAKRVATMPQRRDNNWTNFSDCDYLGLPQTYPEAHILDSSKQILFLSYKANLMAGHAVRDTITGIYYSPLHDTLKKIEDYIDNPYQGYDSDTFFRTPFQIILNQSQTKAYIADENFMIWELRGRIPDTAVSMPKILEYDYRSKKILRVLPIAKDYFEQRIRLPYYCDIDSCPMNYNLKYSSIALNETGSKLYLAYSLNNLDSLTYFDFSLNAWSPSIAIPGGEIVFKYPMVYYNSFNWVNSFDQPYTPFGKSNIKLDENGDIIAVNFQGNIYKIKGDLSQIDTIYYLKDSMKYGYHWPDYSTKNFGLDDWGNLYLPDIQSNTVMRYNYKERLADTLIQPLFLGCASTDSPFMLLVYRPINIQMDCDANIYAEYHPNYRDSLGGPNTGLKPQCESIYFLSFNSKINDSLSLKIFKGDTLWSTAYFYNGDSIKTFYVQPPRYIQVQVDTASCNHLFFRDSLYTESTFYSDTIKTYSEYDTIFNYRLNIYKSYHDTLRISNCNRTYQWQDSTYTSSGLYSRNFLTINQCDSSILLDLTIGLNKNVRLDNGIKYTALQDNVSYQWYRCHPWRKIANETSQTFRTYTKGSYAVVLNDGKGCIDTSDCRALYSSGVSQLSDNLQWTVYPNPFANQFQIELDKLYREIHIKVYDLRSRLVLDKKYLNKSSLMIKNSTLPKGPYYLQIETETSNQFFNILKE